MDRSDFENRVLQHVQAPNYRPVKLRVIAKQLGIPLEDKSKLRVAVRRLAKRGTIIYSANHVVHPAGAVTQAVTLKQALTVQTDSEGASEPKPKKAASGGAKAISGIFRRTSAGNGFVRPKTSKQRGDRSQDIYIPSRKCGDAADGDLVAVRLVRRRSEDGTPRLAGEIVEILQRETHRFVGTFSKIDGADYVQIDGRLFQQPISLGDAQSRNVREGDKIVVEMVRFPSHLHEGEAVVIEVLGARGAPGVDTLSILREYDLPESFPDEVITCAREQCERFSEDVPEGRTDFTNTTTVTIDPQDARDFDDAISLERLENGHWRLGVHIADVSFFVPPKTVLDTEARERATSVYLIDRVIPMLPEIISNHLASLQPGRARLVKSALIEFTADGARVATEIHNGVIRSDRRFTYEEVDAYIAVPESMRLKVSPAVFQLLGRMHALAIILRRRRMDNGAIELTLPEVKVDLDEKGRVSGAHLVENTESHQIIEEFMLAANEAVADFLTRNEAAFLRRTHDNPDPRKLDALTEFVRELGIECSDLHNRFEIKRVIAEVAGSPTAHAVNYSVLRSMAKAVYSPEEQGHYALASQNYCHFTSPIRRYPDLTVHRTLEALLNKKRPVNDLDALTILGDHCSEREQRAEAAERELIKIKLLGYMAKRIGKTMEAVITGVERFGLFAQGVQIPAEGLIAVHTLRDDHYRFDSRGRCLTGHRSGNSFRLGDLVRVEIARVDIERRELDFRLVERLAKAPQLPRTKKERAARSRRAAKGKTTQARSSKSHKSNSGTRRRSKGAS